MATEPLVLLANSDKWLSESLESVLTQGGYRVIVTAKRPQVLDLARRHLPDGVLIDLASGLYNDVGMTRRANELAAFTARQGLPLACAVFQPANGGASGGAGLTPGTADRLALAFRRVGRVSDAVCRTGDTEFAVFAPATDESGAEGLVQRISDAVARDAAVKRRAGVSIAPAGPKRTSGTTRTSAVVPQSAMPSTTDLLAQARSALH